MKLFITNYKEIIEIDKSVLSDVSSAYISLTGFHKIENEKIYSMSLSGKLNIENPKLIIDVEYDSSSKEYPNLRNQYIIFLNDINQLIYQIRQDKLNSLIK